MIADAATVVFYFTSVIAGCGVVGIGLAWLNDRRLIARRQPQVDPKIVLEQRFANGEIDEDDFDRKMHRLLYGPPLELDRPPSNVPGVSESRVLADTQPPSRDG